jgi:hypothetical protein
MKLLYGQLDHDWQPGFSGMLGGMARELDSQALQRLQGFRG